MISDEFGNIGSSAGSGSWHEFIQIGDKIYNNMRPYGAPASEFWKDIGGEENWRWLLQGGVGRWSEIVF